MPSARRAYRANPARGPDTLIEIGEKIPVIMRRNFESQMRRHFAGEVVAVNGAEARAMGYVFVYDDRSAQYVRKQAKRTTILDLAESDYMFNIILPMVNLDEVRYETIERTESFFTDGKNFRLNINEFGTRR